MNIYNYFSALNFMYMRMRVCAGTSRAETHVISGAYIYVTVCIVRMTSFWLLITLGVVGRIGYCSYVKDWSRRGDSERGLCRSDPERGGLCARSEDQPTLGFTGHVFWRTELERLGRAF